MYVLVLNDGETYTDLEGCAILDINPEMLHYSGRNTKDEAIKDFMNGEGVTGINLVLSFSPNLPHS
jgi:hypothetical protein